MGGSTGRWSINRSSYSNFFERNEFGGAMFLLALSCLLLLETGMDEGAI
jgi:hypothetical protein